MTWERREEGADDRPLKHTGHRLACLWGLRGGHSLAAVSCMNVLFLSGIARRRAYRSANGVVLTEPRSGQRSILFVGFSSRRDAATR